MTTAEVIQLSKLLGEMGSIKRATDLPNGDAESDSHHSFSLALIAYQFVVAECSELDVHKVVLFALAHDLLEIITGDQDTLHFTVEQHAAKQAKEQAALKEFDSVFAKYPDLRSAMYEYEKLDTPEAATVFVLDKACTTWTWVHHPDHINHTQKRGIAGRKDVEAWAGRMRDKIESRLQVQPPQKVLNLYEESFEALRNMYEN